VEGAPVAGLQALCARAGPLGSEPFTPAVRDFYLTNAIARASAVMGELSALRNRAGTATGAPTRHG